MKGRFVFLGAFGVMFAVFAALTLWSDAASAASLVKSAAAVDHSSWMHTALQASPALIALRAQLKDLTTQAERKLGEVSDSLAPEAIRSIEQAHAALVEQADLVRSQIAAEEVRASPTPHDTGAVLRAERERSAGILDLARRAALTGNEAETAIAGNVTIEAFRAQIFDTLVSRQASGSHTRIERDETETRRLAMSESLAVRFGAPGLQPGDAARSFMDYGIVDLAAEVIGHRGRIGTTFAAREDIIRRAMHASTDFPVIMENALNRALQGRYAAAEPTYRRLARQRSYVDFRDHISVRVGDFPKLQAVNPEGGEIKGGTFSESKEKTAVKAYAVRVDLSRQMLVNDRIGAIAAVLSDQATAVAMFEDETFYGMALSGTGANGPTLMETTRQVFNTTDGTLSGANAAITIASISAGRAALRKRTSMDGRLLNISAAILLVGPDKETEAQQLVAPIQAQQIGNINPFSGTLEVITTARITGNAWHLLASPAMLPIYEWGLLEGYTAPRMRTDEPFGIQGMSVSLEHDFGCGAIDFRGGYKNIGA
ncbi:Mu-like prophage major head subunit gpT family protein [Bosea sp. LjRoot9]|uniref:phage major capsid protein n=1 Tax=Bosea sp. LjRoot9 TaxID=3342341 RepID=UPI003ECC7F25